MQRVNGLLIKGFDGDRDDVFVPGSLEQRFGVGAVGLASLTVSGHVGRWKQGDLVAERLKLPPPVVSRATGLHEDVGR